MIVSEGTTVHLAHTRKCFSPKLKYCKCFTCQHFKRSTFQRIMMTYTNVTPSIKFTRLPTHSSFRTFSKCQPPDPSGIPRAKLLPTAHAPAAGRGEGTRPALSPATAGTPDSLPIKPVTPVHPSAFIGGLHRCRGLNWKMAGLHSCQGTLIWPVVFAFLVTKIEGSERSQPGCHSPS